MPNLVIWYIICTFLIVAFTFISVKFNFSKKTVFYIMAGVSFVSEMTKIFTHMDATYFPGTTELAGYYIAPATLPFHLCSILIFIHFYFVLSKDEERKAKLLEFVVPVGLIGGLMGVLFATSGTGFKEISAYQSFIYHSAVIWFALHFMILKQVKLGKESYVKNLITMFGLSICAIWINGILRANVLTDKRFVNFMFVAKPPMDGLPLLNLDNGWPVYFITLMVAGFILITLTHLYFLIKEKKKML